MAEKHVEKGCLKMATYTTNLSLIKPAGTDKIRIAQINQNMDTIDAAIGAVGNTSLQTQVTSVSDSLNAVEGGIAIVSNNNTHVAITSGQYVYVKNHATLSEGLYRATQAIAANGTLTLSNVTPESAGGLNSLNEQIGTIDNRLEPVNKDNASAYGMYYVYDSSYNNLIDAAKHYIKRANSAQASGGDYYRGANKGICIIVISYYGGTGTVILVGNGENYCSGFIMDYISPKWFQYANGTWTIKSLAFSD